MGLFDFMKKKGFNYSEHPNSSEKDHKDGKHAEIVFDEILRQHVFKFSLHANDNVIDGDRGKILDRQRNEMKTQTGSAWFHMNGNWDEWQRLEWKFKIPKTSSPPAVFATYTS